jgi:hypothetical protein
VREVHSNVANRGKESEGDLLSSGESGISFWDLDSCGQGLDGGLLLFARKVGRRDRGMRAKRIISSCEC